MSDTIWTVVFILLAVVVFGAASVIGYRKLRRLQKQDRSSAVERGEILAGPGEMRLAWIMIVSPLVVMAATVIAILAS
jgi:hypothetical protein